jgi:hypothetical protein
VSEPAVSSIEGALFGRGVGRFAQLIAVGFARSAPLLPAVFAGFGLGTYSRRKRRASTPATAGRSSPRCSRSPASRSPSSPR